MEGSLRSGMEKNLEAHNRGNLNFVVITNAGGPEARTGSGATFDIEMNLARPGRRPCPGVNITGGQSRHHLANL